MDYEFSLKEIESVVIKATYKIELDNRIIEPGEVIAVFDKLFINNYREINDVVTAHGGYGDRNHVWWDTTKEVKISFTQGIFSPEQLTLLTNAKLIGNKPNYVMITNRETLETDENMQFELKETPSGSIFIYDKETSQKVDFTIDGRVITIVNGNAYKEYIVDYEWAYVDGARLLKVGQKLTNGFVTLEGRTKIKEDISGQVKTGIIKIPKLRLLSNLSMRLGKDAVPQVGGFSATALPVGERGQQYAMELYLLDDDIDSDF